MANLQFFEYNMLRRSNERKYSMENLEALVLRLIDLPTETMWVEFKHNNFDSEMIGKDICAIRVNPRQGCMRAAIACLSNAR